MKSKNGEQLDLKSMSIRQLMEEEKELVARMKGIRQRYTEIDVEERKRTEGVIAKLIGQSTGIHDGIYAVSVGNDGSVTVTVMTDEQLRNM